MFYMQKGKGLLYQNINAKCRMKIGLGNKNDTKRWRGREWGVKKMSRC